jgi:hypothetical protein
MARAGSQTQFDQAAEDLLCYAGLKIEAREIERVAEEVGRQVEQWLTEQQDHLVHAGPSIPPQLEPGAKFYISFDGTGIPVRKSELLGRKGKQADGSARTREVKLGCVFTQVGLDQEGHPQRDPESSKRLLRGIRRGRGRLPQRRWRASEETDPSSAVRRAWELIEAGPG